MRFVPRTVAPYIKDVTAKFKDKLVLKSKTMKEKIEAYISIVRLPEVMSSYEFLVNF